MKPRMNRTLSSPPRRVAASKRPFTIFACFAFFAVAASAYADDVRLLNAIQQQESSTRGDVIDHGRSDGGKSRGPFRIKYEYWQDSGVPGRWSDCDQAAYARRVVRAY